MIEALAFLGTAATGGLTGILFSGLKHVFGFFKDRAEEKRKIKLMQLGHDHEIQMRAADLQYMKVEAENRQVEVKLEQEGLSYRSQFDAFNNTLTHDSTALETNGSKLLTVAEFCRRTYRMILTTLLMWQVSEIYSGTTDPAIKLEITEGIVFLTSTAVAWWFADRSFMKKRNG